MHDVRGAGHPLKVLASLDNDDKHRLLRRTFVYPEVATGLDLIEVLSPGRLKASKNLWTEREPLIDTTPVAIFVFDGPGGARDLRSRRDRAVIGWAIGPRDGPRLHFDDMIDAVAVVVEDARELVASPAAPRRRLADLP